MSGGRCDMLAGRYCNPVPIGAHALTDGTYRWCAEWWQMRHVRWSVLKLKVIELADGCGMVHPQQWLKQVQYK